jgi:hypothetical protein
LAAYLILYPWGGRERVNEKAIFKVQPKIFIDYRSKWLLNHINLSYYTLRDKGGFYGNPRFGNR